MTYKTKQCQYCNTSYTPTSGKQKFCSSKCFNKIKAQKVMKSRDPVQYREYMREFRAKNQERIRQWERDRYYNNPEINRKKKERARQRRFGDIDINEIYERDGRVCLYCGDTSGPFHIDHKTPLSRGGKNTKDNLTVACADCNLKKHTMTVEEFQSC